MQLTVPRQAAAALLLAVGLSVAGPAASAGANPISSPSHAVFVVKDLGGGAYWNVTTSSMYVVQAGSIALLDAAQVGSDLLATTADDGRTLLLLVNGAVLVPVQQALGG